MANLATALALVCVVGFKHSRGMGFSQSFLRPFTIFEWWMLFFQWFLHGNSIWSISPYRATPGYLLTRPLLLAVQAAGAGLFLRGLLPSRNQTDSWSVWGLPLYLATPPVVLWLLTELGNGQMYIERYLMMGLPFFAIALARGATRSASVRVNSALAGGVGVLGVVAYAMCLYKGDQWTVYKHNPDWRSAVQYLSAQDRTPGLVVVFAAIPIDDLGYYVRRQMPDGRADARYYIEAELDSLLARRQVGSVYLVKNLYWTADFDRLLEHFQQDPRLRPGGTQSFKGVALYAFAVRGSSH